MSETEGNDKKEQIPIQPLRGDIQIFQDKRTSDGQRNWIIFDPVADKYYRLGLTEYLILSLLKEVTTQEELFEKAKKLDETLTDNDIKKILSFLQNSSLLQSSYLLTEKKLKQTRDFKQSQLLNRILQSYLFLKIPVWSPDKFLSKTLYIVQAICNKWLLIFYFFLAICGFISLIANWSEFETAILGSLNFAGLVKYGVTIIFLKVLHEFAHGYAAKSAGIRVRRFGIGLIVFFPRFFTDLTDAWRIAKRHHRVLIDAAGILAEGLIGGIAILFWAHSGPGIIKTLSYYIFTVSLINTTLINGNPFIRYDGYYILMDSLNIDNLQQRSRLLIVKAFREGLFGIKTPLSFSYTGWKKLLLILYGISSFIYRIFLYTAIIFIVYYKFTKIIGIVLVIIELHLLVFRPIGKEIKAVIQLRKSAEKKRMLITLSVLGILLFILFCPLPWTVSIPCRVGSPQSNVIYVNEPGYLKSIKSEDQEKVNTGEILFQLENPLLEYKKQRLKTRLELRKTELDRISTFIGEKNSKSLRSKMEQIHHIKNMIKENKQRQKQLSIKSPLNARFVIYNWRMKPGKWLEKGQAIGEVFSEKKKWIYAYAKEKYVDKIELGDEVNIFIKRDENTYHGRVVRVSSVPRKKWHHPSPLLDKFGGNLPVLRKNKRNIFILKNYYYQIIIKPEQGEKLDYSRTGFVHTRAYTSIGMDFLKTAINTLRRELSF